MRGHHHLLIADGQGIVRRRDLFFENTHHRIVFEKIGKLLVFKQVIDANDIDIVTFT